MANVSIAIMGLVAIIDETGDAQKLRGRFDPKEKIAPLDAYQSVRQLIGDLSEALFRTHDLQGFLSTSLFLFWMRMICCSAKSFTCPSLNVSGVGKVMPRL